MLTLRKVAVTGHLACGKTTVCQLLKELGAYTMSADQIVHDLYSPHTPLGKKIITLLGTDVLSDNVFDRKKIACKVFNNPSLLRQLEELLHPEVRKVVQKKYDEIIEKKEQFPLFVVEIPLLFESGMESDFDSTIAVEADYEICKRRFKGSPEEFEKRYRQMFSSEEKSSRADFVISNNGTLDELKQQTTKIFNTLKKL